MWNDLVFRDDDIVIATYAKSATTWMQQIVAQLLFGGDPELAVAEMSPWLDLRVPSSRPARHGPVEVIQPWVGSLRCTPQAGGSTFPGPGYNGIQASAFRIPAFPRVYSRSLGFRVPSAPPEVPVFVAVFEADSCS